MTMNCNVMRSIPRYLALAGLTVLAACQQPGRIATESGATRQAAATTQQISQQTPRAAPEQAAPAITFHLAQTRPAQGLAQLRVDANTSLYAVPQPVFTQADMQQVVSVKDKKGQAFLRFDFNQQGAAKLAQVTREALGNYLIVSIRGKLVAIQRISDAQQDGKLPVQVNSESDAHAVLNLLRQSAG